ncbi:MAG: phosphoribosylanthranilate isomerase [Desulfuromonas sp.]|nr:MAG: phosphoribosylanthranilate isomerase [Desulfuromonas sp.]
MVRVKICGITNEADALHAVACGADALGFVFFAKSPRCVDVARVRAIVDCLPPLVATVGLFVNETVETVNRTVAAAGIDVVQLHGDETPEDCRKIERPVIKALRVKGRETVAESGLYPVRGILLDAWHPDKFGGTGSSFDWTLAAEVSSEVPLILAGGLTPENVADAIRAVNPYAVDVSSGVESAPGKKDPEKVAAFIANARKL